MAAVLVQLGTMQQESRQPQKAEAPPLAAMRLLQRIMLRVSCWMDVMLYGVAVL